MSYHYLEVIQGIEKGRRYLLSDGAISVGRSSQNTLPLHSSEKSVSGHHAIIYKNGDRITLQDLESTNGTYVNEEKVGERELSPGDMLGFGKAGPRLKLIRSETEPDLSAGARPGMVSAESTSVRTVEDEMQQYAKKPPSETTGKEDQELITKVKLRMPREAGFSGGSQTMDMEKKILEKKLGASDMQKLMRDEKRVDKIIERGKISDTQASMLRTAAVAHRRSSKQWVVILCAVVAVSITAISFFAIRAYQYKSLLSKGLSLRAKLDAYEAQIEAANKDPDANRRKLDSLINELDKAKTQLSAVKKDVHENDFGKFYSDPLEKTIDEVLMRFGETDYHIPKEMVDRVRYHIGVYSGDLHATIAKYIGRKEKYFSMIRRIFHAANLPEDLAYVSMLESGFNPRALSHAGARGMWQFMTETGRRYGLKIEGGVDERCEPEKATHAAAKYFRELIAIFGGKSSVMLAMAAYNAGEARVVGALRKIDNPMRNRDFWYIYRMGYLAEETNEYIPRVIALLIISEHPDQYGFTAIPAAPTEQADAENDFIPLDNFKDKE
ncbi:MAG TPA: transglycosylase SLT domain-containing protein [Chitinivibrionales bacterium]|nr:transglycosylase SLT domain-containing protein [Chitinivibrionales bacterium]